MKRKLYPNGVTVSSVKFKKGNRGYTAHVGGRKLGFYHVTTSNGYGKLNGKRFYNFFKWLRAVKSLRLLR